MQCIKWKSTYTLRLWPEMNQPPWISRTGLYHWLSPSFEHGGEVLGSKLKKTGVGSGKRSSYVRDDVNQWLYRFKRKIISHRVKTTEESVWEVSQHWVKKCKAILDGVGSSHLNRWGPKDPVSWSVWRQIVNSEDCIVAYCRIGMIGEGIFRLFHVSATTVCFLPHLRKPTPR